MQSLFIDITDKSYGFSILVEKICFVFVPCRPFKAADRIVFFGWPSRMPVFSIVVFIVVSIVEIHLGLGLMLFSWIEGETIQERMISKVQGICR